ncbi:aldo/keto reductase [Collinsella sp. zg1085]|uniref:aldo/keto reductase n=1 Tax=Collinsella sp. zg1085 TaxID=2844380 RepID=UPI001C0B3074|nr:aldo/keto reductase [Collinsella sp. zg1085]QWT17526.1 aldo/keto reductase [Collinsella sp. zg1085]
MEYVELKNGVIMPIVGYGTYRTPLPKTRELVLDALEAGYRLIDTAQCYGNESGVGKAVEESGIPRSELFITTKTWTNNYRDTVASIERSLEELRCDYVDLLLIHEPSGDIEGIYRALEEAYENGKARAIGVSNFLGEKLENLLNTCRIAPMVNQVETHPLRQQNKTLTQCMNCGIIMQSWSPLVAGNRDALTSGIIESISSAHGKTPAQVALRWLVQRSIPVIPKSTSIEHMRDNLDIFDFELTESDMEAIAKMDTGKSQFGWW